MYQGVPTKPTKGPRPARNREANSQVSPQQGVTACLKRYLWNKPPPSEAASRVGAVKSCPLTDYSAGEAQ